MRQSHASPPIESEFDGPVPFRAVCLEEGERKGNVLFLYEKDGFFVDGTGLELDKSTVLRLPSVFGDSVLMKELQNGDGMEWEAICNSDLNGQGFAVYQKNEPLNVWYVGEDWCGVTSFYDPSKSGLVRKSHLREATAFATEDKEAFNIMGSGQNEIRREGWNSLEFFSNWVLLIFLCRLPTLSIWLLARIALNDSMPVVAQLTIGIFHMCLLSDVLEGLFLLCCHRNWTQLRLFLLFCIRIVPFLRSAVFAGILNPFLASLSFSFAVMLALSFAFSTAPSVHFDGKNKRAIVSFGLPFLSVTSFFYENRSKQWVRVH